ncbi:SH3 domain-containing protein [Rhizobium halophytocola]|uniref:SH3b domain-containing protein n=1 Tax=Rhizobium halophytocola TaxID=735519 RepID=A0ABS4DYM3_9HYPH|nr:SH3 domain-containing protein [Rhizobium halophytocola]MBP1850787.1 hypothetical protein [Rhizobium halophytocola]
MAGFSSSLAARTQGGLSATAFPVTLAVALMSLLLVSLLGEPAAARDRQLRFARGETDATVRGVVRGYDTDTYFVDLQAGQRLDIDNGAGYFNFIAPGASAAMFIGSASGDRLATVVPSSGSYRIEIYLMRSAARRDEVGRYNLSVRASRRAPAGPGPDDDHADGMAGGPDYFAVTGLSARDTLNIRAAAAVTAPVVGTVRNGAVLRNLGCRLSSGGRWCRIATRNAVTGWVNGRFLREAR